MVWSICLKKRNKTVSRGFTNLKYCSNCSFYAGGWRFCRSHGHPLTTQFLFFLCIAFFLTFLHNFEHNKPPLLSPQSRVGSGLPHSHGKKLKTTQSQEKDTGQGMKGPACVCQQAKATQQALLLFFFPLRCPFKKSVLSDCTATPMVQHFSQFFFCVLQRTVQVSFQNCCL